MERVWLVGIIDVAYDPAFLQDQFFGISIA